MLAFRTHASALAFEQGFQIIPLRTYVVQAFRSDFITPSSYAAF